MKYSNVLLVVMFLVFSLVCNKIALCSHEEEDTTEEYDYEDDEMIIKRNVNYRDALEFDYSKSVSISQNVSKILDKLLQGYDKRIRPNYAGPPVVVGITININNINSVSEVNMDYSMDIFFRQFWVDKRLSFDGVNELVIGSDMLHKIWIPDTYIANDRKTYFHKATVQNKFIRIKPDGQVLYSMRLTVTSGCPMNFRYFPMDHQECDLEIESYGFRMEDIQYKWAGGLNSSALDIAPNIELPQLKYTKYKLIERQFKLSTGLYSRLTLRLYFSRSLGYYITQIYVPSTLLVVLSWVSFWLDRTAAPARVSLGITTVLTMVTFIWSTNASLPKISYVKGIDVFLVFCFFMTFASVIEYAAVSYIHHKSESKKRKRNQLIQELKEQNEYREQLKLKYLSRKQRQMSNVSLLDMNNKSSEEDTTGGFISNKTWQNYAAGGVRTNPQQTRRANNIQQCGCNDINQQQIDTIENKCVAKYNQRCNSSRNARELQMVWQKKRQSPQKQEKQQQDQNEPTYLPITIETMPKACNCNCTHARNVAENHSPKLSHHSATTFTLRKSSNAESHQRPASNLSLEKIANEQVVLNVDNCTPTLSNFSPLSEHKNFTILKYSHEPSVLGSRKNTITPTLSFKSNKSKKCFIYRIKACTIDNCSRVIFPVFFFTFHCIYWTYYLKITQM